MKFNNRNVFISGKAQIGKNVRIGDNTVIYDNVIIGDDSVICNDCVIGEPLENYYSNADYQNPPTIIGNNALIRSHAIIYADNTIGAHLTTGHRITIRAGNTLLDHVSIGNSTELHGFSTIGRYTRFHSDVCICEYSTIGDFVWIFPGTILTNDFTPPSNKIKGPLIGNFSLIAVNVITLPGIAIGKHCLVAASSVVTRNVNDFMLVRGNPAKEIMDVRHIISKESGKLYYPWPAQFNRKMPWAETGWDKWLESHPEYQ